MSSKSVVLWRRYCNFSNCQNGRRRHVVFFEIEKFYSLLMRRGSRRINVPNFVQIGQSVVKILRFFDFSIWRRLPSWMVEFTKFHWLTMAGWPRRITSPNFIKIGLCIVELLQFFVFSRWPLPPSWIFEITKFYWLFGSQRYYDFSISQDGGRRHLGFSKSLTFIC